MYRITRTTLRGQFENDQCFAQWLAATSGVRFVTLIDDPTNNSGPNDRRYYIWEQTVPVATPKCANSAPDLVNESGTNGWANAGEAAAAISRIIKKNVTIDEMVKAANEKALSLENIASGVAKDIGKDLDAVGKSLWSSPLVWFFGAVGGGVLLYKVLK